MSDIIIAERASRAMGILLAYTAETGQDEISYEPISDLIADIGHLCDANDIDYLEAIHRGIRHWQAESR